MHSTRRKTSRLGGFTLIELLIVVAIIAILAAIAVPNFLEAQNRAKVSRARSDMRSLATAQEAYRVDSNSYPFDSWSLALPQYGGYSYYGTDIRTLIPLTTPVAYISSVPYDPFPFRPKGAPLLPSIGTSYCYTYAHLDGAHWYTEITDIYGGRGKWLLYSFGPWARWYTQSEMGSNQNVAADVYDATNGTTSYGLIKRYGP
jgi:type II secretion system protein G